MSQASLISWVLSSTRNILMFTLPNLDEYQMRTFRVWDSEHPTSYRLSFKIESSSWLLGNSYYNSKVRYIALTRARLYSVIANLGKLFIPNSNLQPKNMISCLNDKDVAGCVPPYCAWSSEMSVLAEMPLYKSDVASLCSLSYIFAGFFGHMCFSWQSILHNGTTRASFEHGAASSILSDWRARLRAHLWSLLDK